jgi:hypothetical protein
LLSSARMILGVGPVTTRVPLTNVLTFATLCVQPVSIAAVRIDTDTKIVSYRSAPRLILFIAHGCLRPHLLVRALDETPRRITLLRNMVKAHCHFLQARGVGDLQVNDNLATRGDSTPG